MRSCVASQRILKYLGLSVLGLTLLFPRYITLYTLISYYPVSLYNIPSSAVNSLLDIPILIGTTQDNQLTS